MSITIANKKCFVNIEILNLENKQLTEIPDSIDKLTKLCDLILDDNKLTKLPESICNLVNLQELYLYNNQITCIPDSIDNLVNLLILDLGNNCLTSIPKSIGNLFNLRELYLHDNQLTHIPVEMLKIKKSLMIYENSYQIDNLSADAEILIFFKLKNPLTNLPFGLKEIWINKQKKNLNHKLPFGCVIKYY